ncbi:hypothetical protein [Paraburkholderia fungorum]|uniref:hypothetical protein n=1 Tax=Paraburkholderia fungorum TaxID=134537 RepID=UPI00160FF472|nr:hypothetical protein [Paraburkholderia fungorum]MBB5546687.1 hypothetical protein [Paraburkholderia fungorum]
MKKFCLLSAGLRTSVSDDLLAQLGDLPRVRLGRVRSGIVSVEFDGTEAELQSLLADTAWSSFHVSESRTYRLQRSSGDAFATPSIDSNDPPLNEVLMHFAVEQSLPTAAQLRSYIEMFPQFRQDLIEFAVSLVEDTFHCDDSDVSFCDSRYGT